MNELHRALARWALGGAERRLSALRSRPDELQDDFARRLARRYSKTSFGVDHDLAGVRSAKDLRERVPLRRYEEQVPFMERPRYFGLTSGTSGPMKRIPLTDEHLAVSAKGMGLVMATTLRSLETLAPLARGRILYIGASSRPTPGPDGVPEAPISSVAVHHMSPIARARLVPGTALDDLPDWGTKLDALVEMAKSEDIRIVSGLPPWLLSFAERVEQKLGVKRLHDLFPNMSFVVHGGASPEPYLVRLREHYGDVPFRNVFTSTEAFMGFQDGEEPALLPAADSALLEFVPLSEIDAAAPPRIPLTETEEGVDYVVVVSTYTGLFAYPMGDVVRFVSSSPRRFVVVGRVHQRLNVAGEKVFPADIEHAAATVRDRLRLPFGEVCVVARPPEDGRAAHHLWLVETRASVLPSEVGALAASLDEALVESAYFYRALRQAGGLAPPTVRLLSPGAFERWLARTGKGGGQSKIPRILDRVPDDIS